MKDKNLEGKPTEKIGSKQKEERKTAKFLPLTNIRPFYYWIFADTNLFYSAEITFLFFCGV